MHEAPPQLLWRRAPALPARKQPAITRYLQRVALSKRLNPQRLLPHSPRLLPQPRLNSAATKDQISSIVFTIVREPNRVSKPLWELSTFERRFPVSEIDIKGDDLRPARIITTFCAAPCMPGKCVHPMSLSAVARAGAIRKGRPHSH